MSQMYTGLYVKERSFSSDFNETWIFSTGCRKTLKYQTSWKSRHSEPSCDIRIDGQTNGQTWRSWFALRNSANAPKIPVGISDNQAEMPHRTIPQGGGTQTTRPLLSAPLYH